MLRSFPATGSISLLMLCVSVELPPEEKKLPPLTPEAAKQALLKMGRSGRLDRLGVPDPKDIPIQLGNEDEIGIGIFYCNLKTRAFYARRVFPKRLRHNEEFVDGRFEWVGGKWVAKIRKSGYSL